MNWQHRQSHKIECVSPRWAQFDTIKGGGTSVLDSEAHAEAIVVAVVSQSAGAESQHLTISRWRIFIVVVAWRNCKVPSRMTLPMSGKSIDK